MKGFLRWFGDAFAHAMGAIDAEEKSHVPPPIGRVLFPALSLIAMWLDLD